MDGDQSLRDERRAGNTGAGENRGDERAYNGPRNARRRGGGKRAGYQRVRQGERAERVGQGIVKGAGGVCAVIVAYESAECGETGVVSDADFGGC